MRVHGRPFALWSFALLASLALIFAGCAAPGSDNPPRKEISPDEKGAPSPSGSGNQTGSAKPPTSNGTGSAGGGIPASPSRFAGCNGSGPVRFANSPMRDEDFPHILPYGLIAGAHVTPIDHMYFATLRGSPRDAYEVRAIADGVIYSIQPRDINVDTGQARQREWRMDIAHTCTFTSYFDLLTSLDPPLEAEYNKTQGGRTGVWNGLPVKAGQVVGRIGAQTLDFGVYDYNVTLPGFVVPAHYDREPWKVHTVDPFPHFEEPVRSMLVAKNLRVAEPRAGKIDYDLDGRLVGNWFLKGTNGYAGTNPARYWDGHLAFLHDYLDPTQFRFSIGNWTPGREAKFGLRNNTPDPANVSVASGIVKVELVQYDYRAANEPARTGVRNLKPGDTPESFNLEAVQGVVLAELVEPRLLKLEVFPGKSAVEVSGFTIEARLYER